MSRIIATTLLCLLAGQAAAQSATKPPETEQQKACMTAALTDYNKRSLALTRDTTLPSVDTTIAIRRLEEEFCLTLIRCVLDDQNTLRFKGAFNSCLQAEALEKYDAVPREDTED